MGGRSCDLTLPLTLPGWVWDGVWQFSLVIVLARYYVYWKGRRGLCLFLPKLVDPPAPGLIFLMLQPSHMVYPPPAYLLLSVHLGPVLNLEGSSLLSLFLSFSLPPLASSLFLPPLPLSFLHQTTLYCYCQTSCLLLLFQ